MSDTFGADDPSQLQGDMPGMGAAPSPPGPRLPSALGELAQSFTRLFGGGPAPRAAQPGRSPFQFPGQSQIPQPQGQQGQGPQERWSGTTASLALPQGAVQPPANFTPFIKSMPRPSSQWGQEQPFAQLPQSFEVPSIYQGVSNFFGQNGSALTIPLALGMGRYAGDFLNGLAQGQEQKAKLAREKVRDYAEALQRQQETEHHAYADTVAEYTALDPHMNKPIRGVDVRSALYNNAVEIGDDMMQRLIESGTSIQHLIQFQQQRDINLQDLTKANKASDVQDDEDANLWGVPPRGTPGQPSQITWDNQPQPQTQTGQSPNVAPGGLAPTPVPGQPTPRAQSDQAQDGTTPATQRPPKLLPYQQAGLDIARGIASEGLPKRVKDYADNYAAQVDNRMDNINEHSKGKTREQIANELNGISPSIANDWQALLDGKVGLPSGMGAVGSRPYWANLRDLALAVKSSWSAADFGRISELNREYDAGPTGRRMSRTESMAAAGRTLLQAYAQIPEGEKPPQGALEAWLNRTFTGDPKWGRVFAAYHTYIQESQTIASQSGNFHETDVIRVMRETPYTAGPEFIRGSQMMVDAQNAVDTMTDYNNDYKAIVGRDALHYNPNAINTLKTMASYDPKAKRFTQIFDPRLQGLDRSTVSPPGGGAGGDPVPPPAPGWSFTP